MSGTLVPSNSSTSSSSFVQQGSVDWVALSNSSVQFSVAVLARLSKAGIHAFTLQFGRAICCNFALEPGAQEFVAEAIHKVKKYGSYRDLMWFGFGIKDIVTDLADTEEGLTLVALCAAISTTYDSLFAAKVIRELCVLCKAPQSFTPALRQWRMLVDLCAGILTSSRFVTLANGFRRLICGHLQLPPETRHSPTTPLALAEAMLTLARISKRNLVNATISGALDCAWLAAFAELILSLDIGLCDPSGDYLYRSRQGAETLPQLIILLGPTNTARGGEVVLRSKASLIPSGQSLLQKDPALHGTSLLNWQSSWSTILNDIFGDSVHELLRIQAPLYGDGPIFAFALYLKCISLLQRQDTRNSDQKYISQNINTAFANHPVNPLLWTHPDSRGNRFLDFASRRLPELSAYLSCPLPSVDDTNYVGQSALELIVEACQCGQHKPRPASKESDRICLVVLTETIVILLWILVDSDIDDDVYPSITGLSNLYTWQLPANKNPVAKSVGLGPEPFYTSVMNCDYPVLGIDLVFHVLCGLSVSGNPPSHSSLPTTDQLARVGNGICVYHHAVEDPALALDTIFRLRVVRGYISYSGCRYKDLCGLNGVYVTDSFQLNDMHGDAPILSVKTIIQETGDQTRLEMAYLLNYVDHNSKTKSRWLHLPFLFRKLQRIIRNSICPEDCDRKYDPRYRYYGEFHDEENYPQIDANQVNKAWQLLISMRSPVNTWILYGDRGLISIIIGQPLLLYLLVTKSSPCLVPFTDCLKCLLYTLPIHQEIYKWSEEHQEQQRVLEYQITLLTSENARVDLVQAVP